MRVNSSTLADHLGAQGMLPLFYHDDVDTCVNVIRCLYEGGIRSVEFTNRGNYAKENFKSIVTYRNQYLPELLLGVGTIRSVGDVRSFVDAGADFLISPVVDVDIAQYANEMQIPWIPGCMTPTDIHTALKYGFDLVKLFPGNLLTPAFVESVKPLFPSVRFVVTGGVDTSRENLAAWFNAGVLTVGMGSKLLTTQVMKDPAGNGLSESVRSLLITIQSVK